MSTDPFGLIFFQYKLSLYMILLFSILCIKMSDKLETIHPVYIVYSSMSIDQIENIVSQYSKVLYIAIVFNKNQETNKTVVITAKNVYNELSICSYQDFSVRKFFVRTIDLPIQYDKETNDLYIRRPSAVTPEYFLKSLNSSFNDFVNCGLVKNHEYKIVINPKNTDISYVLFNEHVSSVTAALIRFLLKNRVWCGTLIPITAWFKKSYRPYTKNQ